MSKLLSINEFTGITMILFWVVIAFAVIIFAALMFAEITRLVLFIKYHKLKNAETEAGLNASDAARSLLDLNDMQNVQIQKCGFFRAWIWGNSYSVRKKTIFLRKSIINSTSITAVGVALQKVGLAIMDKRGEKSIKVRSVLLPLSYLSPVLFIPTVIIGLIIDFVCNFTGIPTLIFACVGVVLYGIAFVYMLINIKTEKQANRLAMGIMEKSKFLNEVEREQVKDLFDSYILVYVSDFILALLKTIYSILKVFLNVFAKFAKGEK